MIMTEYKFTSFRIMLSQEQIEDLESTKETQQLIEKLFKSEFDKTWRKYLEDIVAEESAGHATDEVKGIYDA